MKVNVVIEIPKKSNIKYEYDRFTNRIKVDRILYGSNVYPHNYGFIENTLDWDGDPLDVLVISNESFLPGIEVPTRIIGTMQMIDSGETDTKLIGVIDCDPRWQDIRKLSDLPKHLENEIKDFFENYKNLQNKKVEIHGFENLEFAKKIFEECKDLYNKYKDMSSEDFIKKMRKQHPEKYK